MFKSIFEGPVGILEKVGGNAGFIYLILGLFIFFWALSFLNPSLATVFSIILTTLPIWLPIATFLLFFEDWMFYIQREFFLGTGRVTLEIKLPQEILKSPEAMELVLIQLHQANSPDNYFDTYIDGKHPSSYSLEMVSRGGDVKFYMNVPRKKMKNIIEAQLYAQYPGIEVRELSIDYTAEIPWDPEKYEYFSLHFNLKKDQALPIKTYYEYGLHTMPKEEEKVDPITSMLEVLASMQPGEHIWIQIIINAHTKPSFKTGSLMFGEGSDWTKGCRDFIDNMLQVAAKRAGKEDTSMMNLTETEKQTITSIERSMGKNAFETRIRGMYIATKDAAQFGERIGALITGWRAYDDLNRNAIGIKWRTDFDWNMFQDPSGKRKMAWKKSELGDYKARRIRMRTTKDTKQIMTTEELATIFHLPGQVALTPTLGRIGSTRSEAPSNLPT